MLHIAMLAALLTANPVPSMPATNAVAQCFAPFEVAVGQTNPIDRSAVKANAAACSTGLADVSAMRPRSAKYGPAKLFMTARLLERAAALSSMERSGTATAVRDARLANLYFRVALGLPGQPAIYHEAARENVAGSFAELSTLHSEIAARMHGRKLLTAYHKS